MVNIEKIQRSILFGVLNSLIISQILIWKNYLNFPYTKTCVITSCFSFLISQIYALLCLCFRGYVKFIRLDVPFIDIKERTCSFCRQPKAERSHHCKRCMRCIKKMDHHCHWLGTCINYDNHGHFIRFLLFSCIGSTFVLILNIYMIGMYFLERMIRLNNYIIAYVVISSLVSSVLSFVTSIHLFKQFSMILKNVTYIELLQKRNLDLLNKKCGDSPYNIGWYNNLIDVFGPAKYLFAWMPEGDGINFKKRWEIDYWPSAVTNIENSIYDSV